MGEYVGVTYRDQALHGIELVTIAIRVQLLPDVARILGTIEVPSAADKREVAGVLRQRLLYSHAQP